MTSSGSLRPTILAFLTENPAPSVCRRPIERRRLPAHHAHPVGSAALAALHVESGRHQLANQDFRSLVLRSELRNVGVTLTQRKPQVLLAAKLTGTFGPTAVQHGLQVVLKHAYLRLPLEPLPALPQLHVLFQTEAFLGCILLCLTVFEALGGQRHDPRPHTHMREGHSSLERTDVLSVAQFEGRSILR